MSAPDLEVALRRYADLLDAADAMCSRPGPKELFRELLPRLQSTVACDFINYALPDPSRNVMHMHLWNGSQPWPGVGEEVAMEDSAVGWVWISQQVLVLDDLLRERRFRQGLPLLRKRGMRSYCVLPLTTSRLKLGALGIASTRSHAFAEREEEFLLLVAEMVGLCLDPTQAASLLIEEKERIRLLVEIGSSLARLEKGQLAGPQERISRFLEPLRKWAGPSHLGLYLYERETETLRLFTRDPQLGPRLIAGSAAPLEGTVAGRVFRNREPEILNYADLSKLPFASVKRGLELGVKSLCMIPVLGGQGPLGLLKVASLTGRAFSPRDVTVLLHVAEIASVFLRDGAQGVGSLADSADEVERPQTLLRVSNGPWKPTDGAEPAPGSRGKPAKLIPFLAAEASDEPGDDPEDPGDLRAEYFSSSTVGFCILDTKFRYLAVNSRLADMHGIPTETHLGKTVGDVLGDVAAKIEPALQRVVATGEPVLDFEVSGTVRGASAPSHWLATYFPIKDYRGGVKQIGVAAMEITEHHKLDESVRLLTNKLKGEQNRLQVLREIGVALARQLDLKQMFAAATSCLEKAIPFDLAKIGTYDPKEQTLRTVAVDSHIGDFFREGEITPLSGLMMGHSLLAGEPATVNFADLQSMPLAGAQRLLGYGIKSLCSVPLVTPRGTVGAMGLASRQDQAFSREDIDLLSHVANSIALALEIALTREALQREKDRLQVLSEISHALSRVQTNFQQTFSVISASIRKIVPYDMAIAGVFNRAAGTVSSYSFHDSREGIFSEDVTIPLDQSVLGRLLEEYDARSFTRQALEVLSCSLKRLRQALDEGLQSLGYVPLVTPRGMLGALLLGRKTPDSFTPQDLDFFKSLASELALAVESATAHKALGREKERLEALREIDAALVTNTDLEHLLLHVSQGLREAVPHAHLAIHLYDEKTGTLRDHLPRTEAKTKIVAEGSLSLDGSIAGQVLVARKARVLDYEELAKVPYPIARRAIEHGVRSLCFVPLITAKGPIAVMILSSLGDHSFAAEDVEFLERVAASLAQAVQNASAHKALQEEKKRLQVLLNVSSILSGNWNVQETFPLISSYLRRVLRQECAFFSLYEPKSNVFVRQAQDFPLGKGLLAKTAPVLRGGPQSLAVAERRPMIFSRDDVQGLRSEAALADWANRFLEEGLKSMCCVPLLRPKGPLGTLTLASTRPEAFGAADEDLLNQVASQLAVALENAEISREVDELNRRTAEEKRYLQGESTADVSFEGIVGDSAALRHVLDQVATVAGSDATTLILGETGTGKELIARAIHRMSGRRERSFVKLNCAAIPTGLLESELFGHEKGAFTGAVQQKIGRLELADQGTLFLDEVGEIPLELQPKLLRVLQDHEFERLGGVRTIKVNLRLVAATNRQLSQSVASGEFRSDLFYRLNVFPLRMPALRERRHDIPALVRHFVHKYASQMGRHIESVPTQTMQALIDHRWPGNVRELENLVERSVILSPGGTLRVPLAELAADAPGEKTSDTLENAEREHILRVLRETRGVISGPGGAAHKLGLKRTTLQSKMQRLRITREHY